MDETAKMRLNTKIKLHIQGIFPLLTSGPISSANYLNLVP